MALKLGQIAVRLDGKKTAATDAVTALYKQVQKPALFNGYVRRYTPYTQDGANDQSLTQPPESVMVQLRFRELLAQARKEWTALIDGTYSQDVGNTKARADIVVDGGVLAAQVPITTLMFLRKQWTNILTFVKAIPTPDPAVSWEYDINQGLLKSKEAQTVQRTKKVPYKFEKAAATDKFPAQVEVYMEDAPIGEYTRIDFCGGCPYEVKNQLVDNLTKLIEAIKVAQEVANMTTEAADLMIADPLFNFVFAPLNNAVAK